MTELRLNDTRENWLNFVAGRLAPAFAGRGALLPERIRIALGFPSTGRRGKRVGECWDSTASRDGTFEIYVRPDVDEPCQAATILAHELCHAAAGIPAKHGPAFRRVALAIGLEGPMKATRAGPAFLAIVEPILAAAGPLPHARLDFNGLTTRPKKQSTRLLKCECPACGYIARVAWKWLEEKGPPHCPEHGGAMEVK